MFLVTVLMLLLPCLGGITSYPFADSCDKAMLQNCPTVWATEYFDAKQIMPPGEFLDKHCESMLEFTDCFANYVVSCADMFSIIQLGYIEAIMSGLWNVCNKTSNARAEYVALVPCVNNKSNGFMEILGETYANVKHDIAERTTRFDVPFTEEAIKEVFCTFLGTHVVQLMQAFFEKCGNLTAASFDVIYPSYMKEIASTCSSVSANFSKTSVIIGTQQVTVGQIGGEITPKKEVNDPDVAGCDAQAFEQCSTPHLQEYLEYDMAIPSADFLGKHCWSVLSFFDCVKSFSHSCLSNVSNFLDPRDRFMSSVDISELCKIEFTFGTGHSPHFPCLSSNRNKFRELIRGAITNITDLMSNNTNASQDTRREIACVFLEVLAPKFLEELIIKCGYGVQKTTGDQFLRQDRHVGMICTKNGTNWVTAKPPVARRTSFLSFRKTKGVGNSTRLYNVSMAANAIEGTTCSTKWFEDFHQTNFSIIHTDFLKKHCGGILSFLSCASFTDDAKSIAKIYGIRRQDLTSTLDTLLWVCEHKPYLQQYLATDNYSHNETYWSTYKCNADPILPHPFHWIREQLRGYIVPSATDLQDNCPKLIFGAQWIVNYDLKCRANYSTSDTATPYRSYEEMLSGFEQLCNDKTSLRQDYDKYFPCIKRQEKQVISIFYMAKHDLAMFEHYTVMPGFAHDETTAIRARNCLFRAVYLPFLLDIIQDQCGTESSNFVTRLLDHFFQPAEIYCLNVTTHLHKISEVYVKYRLEALQINTAPTTPPWF